MAKRGNRNLKNVKIYYPLLLLCYLEVLFWTTTVLSSGGVAARPEDVCYLARETQSLKHADVASNSGGPLHNFHSSGGGSSFNSGFHGGYATTTTTTNNNRHLPGSVEYAGARTSSAADRAAARAALLSLARRAAEERLLDRALRPVLSLASLLPVLKGVPAPFTGVKALSD